MIEVTVNGQKQTLNDDLNIDQLLDSLGYENRFVAVAINHKCVSRKDFNSYKVRNDDQIEVLAPMAGG